MLAGATSGSSGIAERILRNIRIPRSDELFIPLRYETRVLLQDLLRSYDRIQDQKVDGRIDIALARIMSFDYTIDTAKSFLQNCDFEIVPIEIHENLLHAVALRNSWEELLHFADWLVQQGVHPSINICLVVCQKALETGRISDYSDYFRFLKSSWWPLSRKTFSYLFGSHMDRLLHERRHLALLPEHSGGDIPIFKSYRQCSRYMRWQGTDFDEKQFGLITTGLAQAGYLQNAMFKFRHFKRLKVTPPQIVMDALLRSAVHYHPDRFFKIPQFPTPIHARILIEYLLDECKLNEYNISLDTLYFLIRACKLHRNELENEVLSVGLKLYPDETVNLNRYYWELFRPTNPKRAKFVLESRWTWWDSQFDKYQAPVQRSIWLPGLF
jgi:hypothetical protein